MLAISIYVIILTRMESDARSILSPTFGTFSGDDIDREIRRALRVAIRRSAKSREQIAEELRVVHGLRVSVHILNNWTGDSKRERRVPAEAVPALCAVLGDGSLQKLLLSDDQRGKLELGEAAARWLCGRPTPSVGSKIGALDPKKAKRSAARPASRP